MSDDMFDGMISGGSAAALGQASGYLGQVRAQNEGLQAAYRGRLGAQSDMMMQLWGRQDEIAESGRQFDAARLDRSDELAAKREESAFSRLNSALEFQLERAELESKDRQQAFENTLKLTQHEFQQDIQTMQLKELQGQVEAKEFLGKVFTAGMKYSTFSNSGAYADYLEGLAADNEDAMSALAGTAEGQKAISNLSNQVRAARMVSIPGIARLDGRMFGQSVDWNYVKEKAGEGDLASGRLSDDQRQARSLMISEAREAFDDKEIEGIMKALEAGSDGGAGSISESELAVELVREYAADPQRADQKHWQKLVSELGDHRGEMRFKELYETGMLEPIRDQDQIVKLKLLEESQSRFLAQKMADTNGMFLLSEEYADQRQEFEDGIQDRRAEIMSGGNPRAANALRGVVSVENLHAAVLEQAERNHATKRTWMDLAELTGVPGAMRGAKSLLLGGQVKSKWDYVDMALVPFTLVPGVGIGVRAARVAAGGAMKVAGRAALGLGMKTVGKNALRRAGTVAGRGVVPNIIAKRTAHKAMVSSVASLQSKKRAFKLAGEQAEAAIRSAQLGARGSVQGARGGARAGLGAMDDAARLAERKVLASARSVDAEARALVAGSGRANLIPNINESILMNQRASAIRSGAGAAGQAAREPLRQGAAIAFGDVGRARAAAMAAANPARAGVAAARAELAAAGRGVDAAAKAFAGTAAGARREAFALGLAGANYLGTARRLTVGPDINYSGLDTARRELERAVTVVNSGYQSKEALIEVVSALENYKGAVAEYFPDEKVPIEVMETLLNIGNLVPKSVANRLQRAVKKQLRPNSAGDGGSVFGSAGAVSGAGGFPSAGALALPELDSGGMNDLFNQPQ